ncbi:MAG: AAA family ATPase [Clostridia bacterium]|nr:AAA family ATPase [Clostridia bacterium]
MSKTITIRNTKGIKKLHFTFPERRGVYLLVGPNGTGKTTLLICMDRICNSYAFARGFSHPKNITGYDEYQNATIQYDVDNVCVLFRKKQYKWAPSPWKGNGELLDAFGYTGSIFIKADSKRIDATADEIERGTTQAADPVLVRTLNQIFETSKYDNLKKLKVTHGRGKPSSYFNVIKDGRFYYTEKRFSTGEIAILRLIENVELACNGSLVLLDEAEMALHPRVQVNLLNYLKEKAQEKNLTIFISTHSPTLIKSTNEKDIMLLESDSRGNIEVCTPCYPARALGGIDYEESKIFDYVFFVEDDMARLFLKRMVYRYGTIAPCHSTALTSIIPVGGFCQTANLAVVTNNQLFGHSKVFALVDSDAFDDLDQKPDFTELLNRHREIIKDLSVTPEVKFIEILSSADESLKLNFRNRMHCEIPTILNSVEYRNCSSTNNRKLAKRRFEVFINKCISFSGDSEETVKTDLINMLVDTLPDGDVQHLLGPIFNCH